MVDFFSQFRWVIERILRDFWESLKKAIFYPDKCQITNFVLFRTRNMAANCVRSSLLRAIGKPQLLFFNAPTDRFKKKIYRHDERSSPSRRGCLSISRRYFARFSCFHQYSLLRNFNKLYLRTNCKVNIAKNKIKSRLQRIRKNLISYHFSNL